MTSHRLRRLALLTQGVALVGLGIPLTAAGCSKDPPHVNSPPDQQPSVEPPHVNAPPEPKHVNAPPDTPPTPVASESATPAAPADSSSVPKPPKHTNAPPKRP